MAKQKSNEPPKLLEIVPSKDKRRELTLDDAQELLDRAQDLVDARKELEICRSIAEKIAEIETIVFNRHSEAISNFKRYQKIFLETVHEKFNQ